ncbi:hypothetical protein IE81DRAFT_319577 [Ceraceosorus guamensis]|uniref:Uncharacterized protein n=1 Tax=Ceraceosorus guamensis TaxID=1522189 RepID=A0A316W9F3_9BASI|nr:hypothetical protein IE81DRAFT_319577 [Ceraceosorus guamensis]PWN46184.1 hypothetical protein IE81DRAFT_319577 [Ceraceosorus guamensis]
MCLPRALIPSPLPCLCCLELLTHTHTPPYMDELGSAAAAKDTRCVSNKVRIGPLESKLKSLRGPQAAESLALGAAARWCVTLKLDAQSELRNLFGCERFVNLRATLIEWPGSRIIQD